MGGDYAPLNTILGAVDAYGQLNKEIELILLGNRELIAGVAVENGLDLGNFIIHHTSEVIGMGEHPVNSFRAKPDSSMAVGFELLRRGEIDVFASAGNTGAMMTGSFLTQKTLKNISRPCISVRVPQSNGGEMLLLDVGFNSECKPELLLQFARLGTVYAKTMMGVEVPRVALLNIGKEAEKGNSLTRESYKILSKSGDISFIGNLEADALFSGESDIAVTDGFTGNMILKEIEGVYTALESANIKSDFFNRLNYELYGGTPVLGIESNVIIGHGASSPRAISGMIKQAISNVKNKLIYKMKQQL